MHFFRNPEIRRSIFIYLAAIVLLTSGGLFLFCLLPLPAAVGSLYRFLLLCFLLFVCLTFAMLHFSITYRRYRYLWKLCGQIDQMLHSGCSLEFEDYKEGELSILQNEIQKLFLRIQEQSSQLLADKHQLADSMADISHQIRTPLTSIHLLISRLGSQELSLEERRSLLRQLTLLAQRIDWLIEALLKMSRLDAEIVSFQIREYPLKQLVREAAAPLAIPMELHEQKLAVEAASGQETFRGDLAWTVEAIGNILKNCTEHTPPQGEISVRISENAIYSQLLIEDTGPGFASEDLPHLFERFYKGKNASSKSIGIGLALCRMILFRENASVKVENRREGGARFVVRFYKDVTV